MNPLARRQCPSCNQQTPRLQGEALREYEAMLPDWRVVRGHQLERDYAFPDFKAALAFTNRVGALAEERGHHPDLLLGWGRVGIVLWTHAIDGLSEADFVLAAQIDELPR